MFHTKTNAIRRGTAALLCALLLTSPLTCAEAATIEYTVTATRVNIRENANTSSDVVTIVRQGDALQLISTEPNGWLRVSVSGKTGYIFPEYACLTGITGTDGIAVVMAERLNIRATPSTDGKILAVPGEGAKLTVLALTDGWLKVSYNGETGYVSPEYVSLSAGAEATPVPTAAVQPTQAPSSGTVSSVLKKGSEGNEVKALQQKLISMGYLTGTADGIFGDDTYRAVKAFQRDKGLTADGEAGPSTLAALSFSGGSTGSTSGSSIIQTTEMLRIGSSGAAVQALQEKLIALGHLSGRADGMFGYATRSAVKAYQRANGLDADGVVGPSTLAALNGSATAPTLAPAQTPTPTPTPAPQVTPTPAPTMPAGQVVLEKGDRGEAVVALQQKLIALGFLTGEADGIFGSDTKDAVKTFQRNKGIDDDGVVGAETQAALASITVATPAPTQPAATQTPITATLLKKGSEGEEVRTLQEKLISLGYLTGTADGKFGSATQNAVKAFQRDQGLTADGMAGTLTLAALSTAGGVTPPVSNPTGVTLLKYGDTGDAVKSLQTRLKELGYFTGTVGGNFGTLTRDAVKAFQEAADLTADGIAGEKTLNALYASDAPVQELTTLRAGDSGEEVKRLQERLIELGYLTGSADGEFGSSTQAAVMAFQIAADLTSDGIAGETTLKAVYADNAPTASVPSQPSEDDNTPSTVAEKIVETAKKYLGCKYVYACEDPPYFDCSGLTHYVFRQYGYSLLRTAYQQGYNDKYQKLTMSELKTGDLVFFNTNLTDSDKCDHVGIYMGNGEFIHASSSAGKVIISDLSTGYYNTRFSWGRRILTD